MKFLSLAVIAALASPCGSDFGEDAGGPDLGVDAGLGDGGGAFDAAAGSDSGPEAAPPVPLANDRARDDFDTFEVAGAESPIDGADPGVTTTASCYDGEDNDMLNGADCSDPGCERLVSCCTGTTNCCLEGAPLVNAPALDGCTTMEACDSLGGLTPFGDPAPFVHGEGGLSLGGDEAFASGLVGAALDLRTASSAITVTFALPDCPSCLESASVGFLGERPTGDAPLQVLLGLTAAQGEVSVVVQDRVVARHPAPGTSAWTLRVQPTGRVELSNESTNVSYTFTPQPDAHFAVWGHSENPDGDSEPGARIFALSATTQRCEMPEAWEERGTLRFQEGSNPMPVRFEAPEDPTFSTDGSELLAFHDGETVRFARRNTRHEYTLFVPSPADPIPTDIIEPELVSRDGALFLYARKGSVFVAAPVVGEGSARGLAASTDVGFSDGALLRDVSITGIEGDHSFRYALVGVDEGTLRAYASEDGLLFQAWSEVPTDRLGATRVSDPVLTVLRGAYHLYVTVHRGTRRHLAHFVSAELLYWRLVEEDVLGPQGNGAERLGVGGPAVLAREGGIELVYVGEDGARRTLHATARAVPGL